jgi:hypothetical protein
MPDQEFPVYAYRERLMGFDPAGTGIHYHENILAIFIPIR